MEILISYDISENKIRTKIINILLDYGLKRIQKSVFLGELNNIEKNKISKEIEKISRKFIVDIQIFQVDKKIIKKY